ncbi:MAG: hypothetical protein F6K39_35945 [Okeania sp. SIO3B3]|nr:hypothetical protein [Okeania sp. SIO3B3]
MSFNYAYYLNTLFFQNCKGEGKEEGRRKKEEGKGKREDRGRLLSKKKT